ncbi:hypothetical protein GCM10009007_03050 [Formosimonas limnophila]|uniref:Excalibur calcium-binding domain-containing protein n=1 Tax=Formosimonas limnophila TaxID=1384487 RepID=A0A8J3CJP1_9BURK|nr:excalibur calcium-binding domain-containing protein [Formosimonas limnophila]GHA65998.1 hypothetical protein GCM10009007_03050 [Formosimonas limnophila]
MKKTTIITITLFAYLSVAQAAPRCKDFATQAQAQRYFEQHNARSLDRDGDGRACDCLPGGNGKNCPKK